MSKIGEISAGNIYEFNKRLMLQHGKPLKGKAKINKIKEILFPYIESHFENHQYYMLLCNELKSYTMFNTVSNKIDNFRREVIEVIDERGQLYDIVKTEDGIAIELWIYEEEDLHCYHLFPCDTLVLSC